MQTHNSDSQIFSEVEHLTRASQGKRFWNYLIDYLSFMAFIYVLSMILATISVDYVRFITHSRITVLADRIISLIFYAIYMSLVEAIFKGKSLGKLITGTRAVTTSGDRITTATAFKRGFSRAVPFCAFSALGDPCDPWQDRWTDTMVIDEKLSNTY
jgi:uncharacterized RDD family membrane protein YckC